MNNLDGLILDFIHKKIGYGSTLQPRCEFEDLNVKAINNSENESIEVTFKYHFDEDGFSMYDKTHTFEGKILFSKTKEIISWELEEIHTGIAAYYEPYKMKEE
jgi:hypothetical protein